MEESGENMIDVDTFYRKEQMKSTKKRKACVGRGGKKN